MSDKRFYHLKKMRDDEYAFVISKNFRCDGELAESQVRNCFYFAYDMSFGAGEHRASRSGGTHERTPSEIFMNTFQGKISECALCDYLKKEDIETSQVDFHVEGLGKWDSYDIECGGKHIAVKSTKHYGQLLLLETQDWNKEGKYITNLETGNEVYDSFVLVRIKPPIEKKIKDSFWRLDKSAKLKYLIGCEWKYNIAGYITNDDLKYIIENNYIIKKDQKIGKYKEPYKGTKMDADNYYVQASSMRNSIDFIKRMKEYAKR
ncbi:MAG: hypothetical protein NC429_04920 [Lachnospiraceae bacterium]|nr:hypothetical protein [Lachnospiraceae bacterium]